MHEENRLLRPWEMRNEAFFSAKKHFKREYIACKPLKEWPRSVKTISKRNAARSLKFRRKSMVSIHKLQDIENDTATNYKPINKPDFASASKLRNRNL